MAWKKSQIPLWKLRFHENDCGGNGISTSQATKLSFTCSAGVGWAINCSKAEKASSVFFFDKLLLVKANSRFLMGFVHFCHRHILFSETKWFVSSTTALGPFIAKVVSSAWQCLDQGCAQYFDKRLLNYIMIWLLSTPKIGTISLC